ncbi:hypothetical protein D3C78_1881470 [compost metagenome]
MPNRLQARGISNSEPPATPAAPQAQTEATTHSRMAVGISTTMPSVWAAASDSTLMVMDAPAILIVAPRGMAML